MMQEKIMEAVISAINHLESSMKALVEKDERGVVGLIWRAAADLEYAIFLFSLIQQEESETSSWKHDLRLKQVEIGPILVSTQDLLKEAQNSMDAGELHEAYKKVWLARGYLLMAQEGFEKKGGRAKGATLPRP